MPNHGVHPSDGSARNQNGESLGRRRVTPVVENITLNSTSLKVTILTAYFLDQTS